MFLVLCLHKECVVEHLLIFLKYMLRYKYKVCGETWGPTSSKKQNKTLQIKHAYGVVWVPALRSILPLKLLDQLLNSFVLLFIKKGCGSCVHTNTVTIIPFLFYLRKAACWLWWNNLNNERWFQVLQGSHSSAWSCKKWHYLLLHNKSWFQNLGHSVKWE